MLTPKRPVMANGSHGLLKSTVSLASAKLAIVMSAIVPTRHQTSIARVGTIALPHSNAVVMRPICLKFFSAMRYPSAGNG